MSNPKESSGFLEGVVLTLGSMVMTGAVWAIFHESARRSSEESFIYQFGWLMMGGVLFCVYAPGLLSHSKAATPVNALTALVYGLSFPVWGFACGYTFIGVFGIPQAAITGWWLRSISRSWILALSPVAALLPAWVIAMIATDEFMHSSMSVAIGAWNVIMAGAMGIWAHHSRNHLPLHTPSCATCGYDITGIESQICPECGSPLVPRSCRLCGRDLRGFRFARCPGCGQPVRTARTFTRRHS
jgi:hypothetical protein